MQRNLETLTNINNNNSNNSSNGTIIGDKPRVTIKALIIHTKQRTSENGKGNCIYSIHCVPFWIPSESDPSIVGTSFIMHQIFSLSLSIQHACTNLTQLSPAAYIISLSFSLSLLQFSRICTNSPMYLSKYLSTLKYISGSWVLHPAQTFDYLFDSSPSGVISFNKSKILTFFTFIILPPSNFKKQMENFSLKKKVKRTIYIHQHTIVPTHSCVPNFLLLTDLSECPI